MAVALLIGGIELVGVLRDRAELTDEVTTFVAGITLDVIGSVVVAVFVLVWAGSFTY